MKRNSWYVITGGPSTGKTSLIAELQRLGYTTIPEAARTVIDESLEKGVLVETLRSDEKKFQEVVAKSKADIETSLDPNMITFFDRGMQDSEAYLNYYDFKIEPWVQNLLDKASYRKIFLLEPLQEYKKDYARTEDATFQNQINSLLVSAYNNHGMAPIRVPDIGLANRVELILKEIDKHRLNSLILLR